MTDDARDAARGAWWPDLLLLLPWAWLTAQRWFVGDDAYISYRYGKHLAEGHGLVYNLSDAVPVEGYSNLLWVLLAALCETLGLAPWEALPWVSAACGAGLVLLTPRLGRALGLSRLGALVAGLVVACSPTVAVWSTGGLATAPAALAFLALAERLLVGRGRGAWWAVVPAVALALLRTEGPAWVAVVAAVAWWARRDDDDATAQRAPGLVLATLAAVVVAHTAFRLGVYGDWVANTARAKVGFGPDRLARGVRYVLAVWTNLGVPWLTLPAAAVAWFTGGRLRAVALLALAVPAYAAVVGGDYMAFGRLLLPGIPFLALGIGAMVGHQWVRAAAFAGIAAVGLLPGVGIELAPSSLQDALAYRMNFPGLTAEYDSWAFMRRNALRWSTQGKALGAVTSPGDRIVTGAIGARGYFSERDILDRGGLVTAGVHELVERDRDVLKSSPGHDLIVDRDAFLDWAPEVLDFEVFGGGVKRGRLVKEIKRWTPQRTPSPYAPRFLPTTVDGDDQIVVLLLRAKNDRQAERWWVQFEEALDAHYGPAAPPDDGDDDRPRRRRRKRR